MSLKSKFRILDSSLDDNGILKINVLTEGKSEPLIIVERVSNTEYIISELKIIKNYIYVSLNVKINKNQIVISQYPSKLSLVDGVERTVKDAPVLLSYNIVTIEQLIDMEVLILASIIEFHKKAEIQKNEDKTIPTVRQKKI